MKLSNLFLCLFAGTALQANTIVFSNFGPGNTYSIRSDYAVQNIGQSGQLVEEASQFTAGSGGNLARIDIGLFNVFGSATVNVFLYGDAGGLPNTANQIELGSVTTPVIVGSTDNMPVALDIKGSVHVDRGSVYWLVLKPTSDFTLNGWNNSLGPQQGISAYSYDDSTWAQSRTSIPPVFRLTADSKVPDSGSTVGLMLVSCVFLFALIGNRNRKIPQFSR